MPYSEVERAKTLLVVPGRALRGVALGGGGQLTGTRGSWEGAPGRLGGEVGGSWRLGTDRGGRLAAGRAVVPAGGGDEMLVVEMEEEVRWKMLGSYQEQLRAFEQGRDRGQLRERSVNKNFVTSLRQKSLW